MANKLMHIPDDDTQNYPFFRSKLMQKRLDTQLTESNFNKVSKVVEPTDKKTLSKNFGD